MRTEPNIEQFVLNELLYGGGPPTLAPDAPLISSGLLDSMDMLRLIAFIEEQFGVVVESEDVTSENFETLHYIKSFVEKKKKGD